MSGMRPEPIRLAESRDALDMRDAVKSFLGLVALGCALVVPSLATASDDPDLIFKRSTVWHFLTPDHKLAVYAIDDPVVDGVACHFTLPEKGGVSGMLGLAEETSDVSLACRQVGPISFKEKFEQGSDMYRQSRSLFFKKMQIVRGCDAKRNVLVYLVYSDKLIEGSPKNSTSSVPIMPWGDTPAQKCSDWLD
ncbi:CreA protein [Pleomorphomonas diazotrophica]|nr:CreA protein [Pleomorphomonas diazotrophica]